MRKTTLCVFSFLCFSLITLAGQINYFGNEDFQRKEGFSAGLGLGAEVLSDSDPNTNDIWTRLGFQPDIAVGKFGIGLDLFLRFQFYRDANTPFTFYDEDWIPKNGKTILDIYLPKILYIRYGLKGIDPLYVKAGSIKDFTLGNGFIISNYSNMSFLPKTRILGVDFALDGSLFSFPYIGIELLAGNLARFDVLGGRFYVRPMAELTVPVLKDLQLGASIAADTNPSLYSATVYPAKAFFFYGADITVPLITNTTFPLTIFADFARAPNNAIGWMTGFRGKLFSFLIYGAQLRILQEGFLPEYFDANYDRYRAERYDFLQQPASLAQRMEWFATLGTSFFDGKIFFLASLNGPTQLRGPTDQYATARQIDYPHAKAVLQLGPLDAFPVYVIASYEKYLLGAKVGFFQDLIDRSDAIIGVSLNYKVGISLLTLQYDAQWDPTANTYIVSSSVKASVRF